MIISYFNSSILCILLSAISAFMLPFISPKRGTMNLMSVLFALIILVSVIYLKGRSGLLGFISASAFIYWKHNIAIFLRHRLFLLLVVVTSTAMYLFLIKQDSSKGRLTIYPICLQISKDNVLTGVGIGHFKATYNEYQADYFSTRDLDGKNALLADNTFYAFNDYLQWGIETGITGIFFLMLVIWLLLEKIKNLLRNNSKNRIARASVAGLICIGTASIFSYPMQTVPLQLLVLFFSGIIIFYPVKNEASAYLRFGFRFLQLLHFTLFVLFICIQTYVSNRKTIEKRALDLSRSGYKTEAIKEYKKLSTWWPVNGHNDFLLAELLYYRNDVNEAYKVLIRSKKNYVDNRTYKLQAQIENELGLYADAEKSFLRAIYMVPNRISSRLDLVHFYEERKDTANALKWSNSILNMPVKIPSEKATLLLKQTREIKKNLLNN